MKNITKRITSTLLCLMMAVSAFPHNACAEETHDHGNETEITVSTEENSTSGTIGESNVTWEFDTSTGHLTISGSGDCTTFASASDQPWANVREQITEVWFMDMDSLEIPNLAYWFDGCSNLTMAEVPYTTPVIGERAFADCPALETVMLYYQDGNFQIHESAFAVDTLTLLEVRYIPYVAGPEDVLSAYSWNTDNRIAYFTDVYGMMTLASANCYNCGVTCSYTLEYEQWGDNYHAVRWWCSNCGKDMLQGTSAEAHTLRNGVCSKCGYDDGSGDVGGGGSYDCYHDWTSLEWDVCRWYEVCDDCGAVLDTGIEHGDYYYESEDCTWFEYCGYCDSLMDYGTEHGDTYREEDGCTWYDKCENCDKVMACHMLLKEEQTASYMVEIWKRFRKWGGIPTGITQNIKDLLASKEIENIFENSDYISMLNQAAGDRQILAQKLNISPHQLSYVTHSSEGEGLLFYGSVILPFVDRFPKDTELYRIMTTRLTETVE